MGRRSQAAGLTSASGLLGITAGSLGDGHGRELFSDGGMDTNGGVQVLFGHAALDRDGVALGDLARIWRQDVEADHPLAIGRTGDDLRKTPVVVPVGQRPFQRLEVAQVHLDVILAVLRRSDLLRQATAAVLQRGENSRRDVDVVHLGGATAEHTLGEQLPRLNSDGRQLWLPQQDIANGIDVGHVRLLRLGIDLASLHIHTHTRAVEAKGVGTSFSPDCKEDGVEIVTELHARKEMLVGALDAPGVELLELRGDALTNHVRAMILHIGGDHLGQLLVEAPQEHRAGHDVRLKP
mmetsp:Transcript_3936/g.6916  ORF Transcript_3936/g.6916 Transcript_3936/m.6916 type:complete len:294 (-) Transcript_3936:712-1593(-)